MSVGLIGRKCGMTRVFTESGASVPVTVIEVVPNRVVQVKTEKTDGYNAVQLAGGTARPSSVTRALAGHYASAHAELGDMLKEFHVDGVTSTYQPGDTLTVAVFSEGQKVDVQGISKGKGFAGAIKRHNFGAQRHSHGNSLSHRAMGSAGMCQTPGRVFKGKKMPGHMGDETCTVQHQEIVKIDTERHLLLVKGAVPGAPGGKVVISPSVKTKEPKQ